MKLHILIKGPQACGKTTLARALRQFLAEWPVKCHFGITEQQTSSSTVGRNPHAAKPKKARRPKVLPPPNYPKKDQA